jgi:hypothetical protein
MHHADYRTSRSPKVMWEPLALSTAYMFVCCTNHAWMNSIGRARKQLQIPDQIRLKIVMWFLFSMDRSE